MLYAFCEKRNKKFKHFPETIAVENVVKSQIIEAIESIYIKELINTSTETSLHDILKVSTF